MTNNRFKFRVWTGSSMEYDVMTGKFGTFFVNKGSRGDGLDEKDTASLTPFNTKYHEPVAVMQNTNLKDKNGKEIYEGDIVDLTGDRKYLVQIIYADDFGAFQAKSLTTGENSAHLFGSHLSEIIGNIYENSELLK